VPKDRSGVGSSPRRLRSLLSLGIACIAIASASAQMRFVVCDEGDGSFQTAFQGVKVTVGAAKPGELGKRSCSAWLAWDGQELPVAADASQVDIDVLGPDLGWGRPVVGFQVRKSAADWDYTYLIYSLEKPPKLLRSIAGGDFFRAADVDLTGRIAIWTGDVGAIRGFEGFSPADFDFAPAIVLRYERNQLVDVGAEFRTYFDRQIAQVQAGLSADDRRDFLDSDGKLAAAGSPARPLLARWGRSSSSMEQRRRLRTTKSKVLEIVWAYLNSGREQAAWSALADMWPPADLDRIRTALLQAQARGIRSQVDSVSAGGPPLHLRKARTYVYDAISEPPKGFNRTDTRDPTVTGLQRPAPGSFYDDERHSPFVNTGPQPILLQRPAPLDSQEPLGESEQVFDLVIDAAGKVESVKAKGHADQELMDSAMGWKFIPAFRHGQPVASRLRFGVSLNR